MLSQSPLFQKIKEKWQHAGFQRYFRNTGWMFMGQSSMIISLAINIWLARYLGPHNFGIISYVFAFVGIFSFISGLSLFDILIRELVINNNKKDELLGTSFLLLSFGGILAFIVTVILAFVFESSTLIRTLIITYATIFIWSPINIIPAYFQATVRAKINAQAQIINTILSALIKIFLILTGKGIIWFVASFAIDYIIGVIIGIYNYHYNSDLKIALWKFNKTIAKHLLISSSLLMLSAVMGYLLLKIDQVMIKFYLTETAVGLYAVAVKLSEIWYFIPGIICGSIFPAIINAKLTNGEVYSKRLEKLYFFLLSIAIVIAIPVATLAPWIIKFLYGTKYLAAIPILQIYIWSGIGFFLITGINKFLMTENYLWTIMLYNLVAVATNIILNIIFIPQIGLNGAAWSTLISYSIIPLIFFGTSWFKRKKPHAK